MPSVRTDYAAAQVRGALISLFALKSCSWYFKMAGSGQWHLFNFRTTQSPTSDVLDLIDPNEFKHTCVFWFFCMCFLVNVCLFVVVVFFNWHTVPINFITYFQWNEWTSVSLQVPRSHTENIYRLDLLKEINATKQLHFCSLFSLCAAKVNLRTFIHWRLRGAEKFPWSSGYDLSSGHDSPI